MSPSLKGGIIGFVIALILMLIGGPLLYIGIAVLVVAIAIPVGGYMALDKSQRRRLRAIRARQRGN